MNPFHFSQNNANGATRECHAMIFAINFGALFPQKHNTNAREI
jgi:hypothetical protein